MRRTLLAVLALAVIALPSGRAAGLLIPEEKTVPPLAMLNHKVNIAIEDQVAVTKIEQTFRNHTDRKLETTYVFPVPKGASVTRFTLWVDGKQTRGELLSADKARAVYTSIVSRTHDPAMLEYMGNNLLRMKLYTQPRADQKVALTLTAVAPREGRLIEYVYPLKTDGKAISTLEKFSVQATVKSQHGLTNVYSPSHAMALRRVSDREVHLGFDKDGATLDRDFQLFYSTGKDDIGLTALAHRPISAEKGFFTLLVTPSLRLGDKHKIPQDMVFVLDTSGSMRIGGRIEQARRALKYCLNSLNARDRFALINFGSTVDWYEDKLLDANPEQMRKANKWVDDLEATGGTAIDAALAAALKMRPANTERPFTIVFFTDGQPTIGEMNPEKIYKNVIARNTGNTRIFTFGVGDDVNAALLDRIAESTRAISAYVRSEENIEQKVSNLYAKMSNPVLTNLRLSTTGDVRLSEVYPGELPDLFHGGQLVIMGRYTGKGPSAIKLTGKVGKDTKEFVYEFTFPDRTEDGKEFVEQLWARRKVGFLLDQVRINGERKELVDEVTALARKYGITTPYTSYLVVADGPLVDAESDRKKRALAFRAPAPAPVALTRPTPGMGTGGPGDPGRPGGGGGLAKGKAKGDGGRGGEGPSKGGDKSSANDDKKDGKGEEKGAGKPLAVEYYARTTADRAGSRKTIAAEQLKEAEGKAGYKGSNAAEARRQLDAYDQARELLRRRDKDGVTTGKLGVELAVQMNNLRNQSQLERAAVRAVNGRRCMEVGGVWIDEEFTAKTAAVVVKAQSEAYFRILALQPDVRRVYQLGNYLVWVTPSGKALVVDANNGKEKLTDAEIKALFTAKK